MNITLKPFVFYFGLTFLIFVFFLSAALPIFAQDNTTILQKSDIGYDAKTCVTCKESGNCTEQQKQYCGNYQLEDFFKLGIKITKIILSSAGALALGAFVYGGFMWLIAAGNTERIQKGKDAMFNAVIGLVIIFTSYLIIEFTLKTVGYNMKNNPGNQWNVLPK